MISIEVSLTPSSIIDVNLKGSIPPISNPAKDVGVKAFTSKIPNLIVNTVKRVIVVRMLQMLMYDSPIDLIDLDDWFKRFSISLLSCKLHTDAKLVA